jgi:dolichyl-phosphate-mannose-protein mannosyltransferase
MLWKSVGDTNGDERRIDIQGNPVLWYGVLVAIGVFAAALARRRMVVGRHRHALLLLGAGYLMNFLPFAFITRPMYLYHYYFALLYSVALAALAVGILAGWQDDDEAPWRFASARARMLFAGVLALVTVSFVYFAPLSYGTSLSASAAAQRRAVLERQ